MEEVRSFMGLASHYRMFIRNFSHIAYPITSLKRQGKKFEWTEECATSFEQLKQSLMNYLVLKISNMDKEFVVCIDDCKRGLGVVLMQEGQVVYYESLKLNEHERNYLKHDLELEAIIHALKMCRHYIIGRRFVLMINHNGLKYLFEQLNLNARQARSLTMISEFEFEIRCIKGNENKVTNDLSRKVQVNYIDVMGLYGTDLQYRTL